MEDIDICGKRTNDILGRNTIKTLKKRQWYILKKLQYKIADNSYFKHLSIEIVALRKTINFIKWIHDNSSDDTVKEIIIKYKQEVSKNDNEKISSENALAMKRAAMYSVHDENI